MVSDWSSRAYPIKNTLQDLGKTSQDLASWQEICSKSMPTFGTCKNLAYLPRFLFQIHVKILYCLISGQIHARSWKDLAKILSKILARFFNRVVIGFEKYFWLYSLSMNWNGSWRFSESNFQDSCHFTGRPGLTEDCDITIACISGFYEVRPCILDTQVGFWQK